MSTSEPVRHLWRMHFEQTAGTGSFDVEDNIGTFDWITSDLSFNDTILEPVRDAWLVVSDAVDEKDYMHFDDREGFNDEEDVFDT
jgi:hypothetical protein